MLTVIDGKRANVTIPNDSNLVDIILDMNGIDISVFEADLSKSYINVLGNFSSLSLLLEDCFFLFKRLHAVFSK
jgi:cell division protease FtsH